MSERNAEQPIMATPKIDWAKMKDGLPKTAWQQLEDVQRAYEANNDDPARAVEMALREKVTGLRRRFEALKKETGK
jgi:N12 class adenine-specific DNA methylase